MLNNYKLVDNFIPGIILFLIIHKIPYCITLLTPVAKITLISRSTTKKYILGIELASILLEKGKRQDMSCPFHQIRITRISQLIYPLYHNNWETIFKTNK